jgi:hypothetical protein
LARNVTVAYVATETAVTVSEKDHVPVSPCVSESVPDALYVPASSGPVVDIKPEELTITPELGLVVTNVTVPVLPSTLIGPEVNDADKAVDVVPVLGEA